MLHKNSWRGSKIHKRSSLNWAIVGEHYNNAIMGAMASPITSRMIVYSTAYSGADQRKYQSSASLAFVWEIHRWPVNSPHKWPVTRKMFPFDDVTMEDSIVDVCMRLRLATFISMIRLWHGWLITSIALRDVITHPCINENKLKLGHVWIITSHIFFKYMQLHIHVLIHIVLLSKRGLSEISIQIVFS